MSRLSAELKKPSELSAAEREAWVSFTDHNDELASPYFRIEFADCCEEVRSDTRVIVGRKADQIAGFLPLQLGKFGYARPLAGPLGDVHGLIVPPGYDADPLDYMRAANVGLLEFHSAAGVRQAWRNHGVVQDGSWICDLASGFDAYVDNRKKMSSSAMRNIRSRQRRLEAMEEGFEYRIEDFRPEVLSTVVAWKREQYRRTGVFDVFSVGWTGKLLAALLAKRSDRFRGTCSTLLIGNKIAAAHIGMASEKLSHYWFPVYDPDHSRVSPGILLLMEILRDAAARGEIGMDLGPGNYRFKEEMGSYQVPLWQGCVMTRSAPCLLRHTADALAEGFERLPVPGLASFPRRAMRKADKLAAFYAW
ncbi:GNAT family N-acetyltransferase [Hyphobacterium sp. HN65]|uniref:GNAT family N-acetyltransferase n=1 Tax=Hyphobacterium lacteum TaxID=3116575 RepID=A0ABU7LND5_9PROT|nr:GNAT family N-acetyltransferase [Hyphobacterium sp. HN65]MEE2525099.1 GNAT family N-acetyltransferase [Hyphobacterium sp. HN65]